MSEKLLYKELSYNIVNAAIQVHNVMGPGFAERIYEEALCLELNARNLPFERQKVVDVFYMKKKIGEYILDMVVDAKVILELKAASEHNPLFEAQLYSYLKASGLKLGILLNFGTQRLTYKRIVN